MSFLDSLENNLKSAEAREERDAARSGPNQRQRDAERTNARAAQPYIEQLRKGQFTADLLAEATRIAHGLRTKVYITWIENTLRLDAREHRLELRPTPSGVVARFCIDLKEIATEPVDLHGDAKTFAQRWLSQVGPRPAATPAVEDAE